MPQKQMLVRPYRTDDEESLVSLWQVCELTVPWNNPHKDIARKLQVQPELFLVGILDSRLIATVMGGYDGHRGWINYLAVHPDFQGNGYGQEIMNSVETALREMGCILYTSDDADDLLCVALGGRRYIQTKTRMSSQA